MLLAITVLTEIFANFLLGALHLNTNYPVYNCFLLVQYVTLGLYFKIIILSKRTKFIIKVFMCLFPLFWLFTDVFIFGLNHWNSYVILVGDLFIICFAARYLYELFTSEKLINFKTSPEFWIAAATIFYSCCELPITGILNYLATNNRSLNSVLQVLNIIMYLVFIYAFLCKPIDSTRSSYSS